MPGSVSAILSVFSDNALFFVALLIGLVIIILLGISFSVSPVGGTFFRSATRSSRAQLKGKAGEYKVSHVLGGNIDGVQYVINDLLFRDKTGHSCQIDHIFINRHGIWVIETKNYAGMIYGDENRREWLQVLAYGKRKNKFYNPIKQNATHIFHLRGQLGIKYGFHNIVVFSNEANLSHVTAKNIYTFRNIGRIRNTETDIVLSSDEIKSYYEKLLLLQQQNEVTLTEHVDDIRKRKADIALGICPRCGKQLVVRQGKNGKFYGCSGYPNCKFTKKL